MALLLTEEDVTDLLTMDAALDAVENAFRLQANGRATNSPRSRLKLPFGSFNLMTATSAGLGVMGLKAYGATQGNAARFYVQLSSTETGELLALIEASTLGRLRTGAASGVATRHMARQDASTLGVIGTGRQARTQIEAVCRVRDVGLIKVFSRNPERRESFAAETRQTLGVSASAVDSAEACVRDSDIVVAITNSFTPVLSGEWLSPGAHVNAAGANHWMRRELDDEAVSRSSVIVVDDVEQAKIECGDLIYPVERGLVRWERVQSLSELIAGRAPGRASEEEITLFESQGIALEDIAVGMRVYQLAKEKSAGKELPF